MKLPPTKIASRAASLKVTRRKRGTPLMNEDEKRALLTQIRDFMAKELELRLSRQSLPDPRAQAPASPPSDGQSTAPDPQDQD